MVLRRLQVDLLVFLRDIILDDLWVVDLFIENRLLLASRVKLEDTLADLLRLLVDQLVACCFLVLNLVLLLRGRLLYPFFLFGVVQ